MSLIMNKLILRSLSVGIVTVVLVGQFAGAASLGDYKKNKMGKKEAPITNENCPEAYTKDCQAKCASGDTKCADACVSGAPQFCEDRSSRRFEKQLKIAAEGASLAAGAVAMIFDDKMNEVSANGTIPISPYAIFWDRGSLVFRSGMGMMKGLDGTYIANSQFSFRKGALGFGSSVDSMWDGKETMAEADFGPTFSLGSANMLVTFQPSLCVSAGNGHRPVYGFGLRSTNYLFLDRGYFIFDPLLSYVNRTSSYDLKLAYGYRFAPAFFGELGYFYKNAIDLNDLNITDSGLQGAFLRFGLRIN